jgi:hypothetical protein
MSRRSARVPQSQAPGTMPYVGMRPFEPEEKDWFCGRDDDAELLTDRILASRLTMLYAYSGLGKSSVLRALVIPKLKENGSLVLYFDAWSQEDPCQALKEALVDVAARLGIADPGAGSPSLLDVVRLLGTVATGCVTLVLDQFEEFLIRHAQKLDPLRKEIAAVVRATGCDAAVVFSLREEFLAALEPFRQDILNLFQSTYRLEGLSKPHLIEAIRRPAERFGGSCDEKLAEQLIADLRAKVRTDNSDTVAPAVELPMLQLVCGELWDQAYPAARGELTLELYRRLGQADRILRDYVSGVMPRWHGRTAAARLIGLLAPPSGLKMSYSVEDLASETGLRSTRVRRQVEQMAAARILRTRKYSSGERFELVHDALAKIVRDWRERVLRWDRIWRVAAVALIVLIVAFTFVWQRWNAFKAIQIAETHARVAAEEAGWLRDWENGGMLEDLRERPENRYLAGDRFDTVASRFLWEHTEPDRFDRLKTLLLKYEDLIPDDYGARRPSQSELPTWHETVPLRFEHSPARKLDAGPFMMEWRWFARNIAENWGMPVPYAIETAPAPDVPLQKIRVIGPGTPLLINVKADEARALLVLPTQLSPDKEAIYRPVRQFHDRYRKEWGEYTARIGLETWFIVPKWSLPVWYVGAKRIGVAEPTSGSGLTALRVAQQLIEQPAPLLSPQAVAFLLQRERMREVYPATVREAKYARGDRLGADLAAIIRKTFGISQLPEILDGLSERWDQSSDEIGKSFNAMAWVDQDAWTPARLHGPWDKKPEPEAATVHYEPYWEIEGNLPPVPPRIRAYVGEGYRKVFFEGTSIAAPVTTQLDKFRDEYHRQYGIRLGGVFFHREDGGQPVPRNGVRIEVLSERAGAKGPQPDILSAANPVRDFVNAIRNATGAVRMYWITAENVDYLLGSDSTSAASHSSLAPKTRAWIEGKYSLTDVKVMLRAVVGPGFASRDATIRYSKWLLSSLVFWAHAANEHLDAMEMQRFLRRTQRARLYGAKTELPPQIREEIDRAADALVEDRAEEAAAAFAAVIKEDRAAAISAFLAAWPKKLPRLWLGTADLASLGLGHNEELDLEDMDGDLDPHTVNLCRLAADMIKDKKKEAAIERQLLLEPLPANQWPREHARWFAQRFLNHYNPARDDPRLFASASALLKSAVLRLDERPGADAFNDLLSLARRTQANWVWKLADDLIRTRPEGVKQGLPLDLALALCQQERPDRLHRALDLAEGVQKEIGSSPKEAQAHWPELIDYVQAFANQGLARQGEEDRWNTAESLFRKLTASKRESVTREAYGGLVQLLHERGQHARAEEVNNAGQRRWPDDGTLLTDQFFGYLRELRRDAAAEFVKRIIDKFGLESQEPVGDEQRSAREQAMYLAALGSLLVERPDAPKWTSRLLETGHDYRDYVRLMFYAQAGAASPAAETLLDIRWKEIKQMRSGWNDRLKNGDMSVWREMLIGRFAGELSRADLMGKLESQEAWARSNLFDLPVSRRGLLCEAWFYEAMLAKAHGEPDNMRDCLRRCIEVGFTAYFEHAMATFILATSST